MKHTIKSTILFTLLNLLFLPTLSFATTYTVTTADDELDASATCAVGDTDCSLREAIYIANNHGGADTVVFDSALNGTPICLTDTAEGDLYIGGDLTITGNGQTETIIDGGDTSAGGTTTCASSLGDRIFYITNGLSVTLEELTIKGGNASTIYYGASAFGGGIYTYYSILTINSSTISGNTASSGGGISNKGTTTINSSTISGNSADYGGGIYSKETITINSSTISGNLANNRGGGIYNIETTTIDSSTISGNTADYGGGIYNTSGTTAIDSSTISGNTANSGSGGISGITSTIEVKNTILADNSGSLGEEDCSLGAAVAFTSYGYNLIPIATCNYTPDATDIISSSSLDLLSLANYGGSTETMALESTSTVIDAGDATNIDGSLRTADQRGIACVGTCDIGAYEFTCGDGSIQGVEDCDDGGESATCTAVCTNSSCGDGVTNATAGESCDDGNIADNDGCSSTCVAEICGDNILNNITESCDDGNNIDGDGCNASCVTENICGNNLVEGPEQCDDGNRINGDGCNSRCQTLCGDSIISGSETCDDGNRINGDGCSISCVAETCGDGVINNNGSEICDDNNTTDGDGCSSACQTTCGDGILASPEETCDDANILDGDGCSSTCVVENTCGDGIINGSETCDDSNTDDGDGCDSMCQTLCGDGIMLGTETCDDANTVSGDGCNSSCVDEGVCGDGSIGSEEQCDDSNTLDGDGCSATCTSVCGDGIKNGPEECDDGNTFSGDGCSATCLDGRINHTPIADAGPEFLLIRFSAGHLTRLIGGRSSDPDGDHLSYTWDMVAVPSGSALSTTNITNRYRPMADFIPDTQGLYVFFLTVSDPEGLVAQDYQAIYFY